MDRLIFILRSWSWPPSVVFGAIAIWWGWIGYWGFPLMTGAFFVSLLVIWAYGRWEYESATRLKNRRRRREDAHLERLIAQAEMASMNEDMDEEYWGRS